MERENALNNWNWENRVRHENERRRYDITVRHPVSVEYVLGNSNTSLRVSMIHDMPYSNIEYLENHMLRYDKKYIN